MGSFDVLRLPEFLNDRSVYDNQESYGHDQRMISAMGKTTILREVRRWKQGYKQQVPGQTADA